TAVPLGVYLDGAEQPLLQPEPNRLWLPLAGPGGARRVVVEWSEAGPAGSLARPDLSRPVIEGVASFPVLWTVQVPPGFDAGPGRRLRAGPRPGGSSERPRGTGPGRPAGRPAGRGRRSGEAAVHRRHPRFLADPSRGPRPAPGPGPGPRPTARPRGGVLGPP